MPTPPLDRAGTAPSAGRVIKTLRPGQAGTLKLQRRYGESLLCVRYREDPLQQTRYTTIELVIEEAPIQRRLSLRSVVAVHIPWHERELRTRALSLGAKWDAHTRLWRMPLAIAKALELTENIRPALPISAHGL